MKTPEQLAAAKMGKRSWAKKTPQEQKAHLKKMWAKNGNYQKGQQNKAKNPANIDKSQ